MSKLEKAIKYIEFFEAIPEENWTIGAYTRGVGLNCALGHCRYTQYDKKTKKIVDIRNLHDAGENLYLIDNSTYNNEDELEALFMSELGCCVPAVNDENVVRPEATPKARILAALNAIKEKLSKSVQIKEQNSATHIPIKKEIEEEVEEPVKINL